MRIERDYDLSAEVIFEVADGVNITHWMNPDTGQLQHRMGGIYPDIQTEEEVFKHLADNAVFNGVADASRLDGWGDLERGLITMHVNGSIE